MTILNILFDLEHTNMHLSDTRFVYELSEMRVCSCKGNQPGRHPGKSGLEHVPWLRGRQSVKGNLQEQRCEGRNKHGLSKNVLRGHGRRRCWTDGWIQPQKALSSESSLCWGHKA